MDNELNGDSAEILEGFELVIDDAFNVVLNFFDDEDRKQIETIVNSFERLKEGHVQMIKISILKSFFTDLETVFKEVTK